MPLLTNKKMMLASHSSLPDAVGQSALLKENRSVVLLTVSLDLHKPKETRSRVHGDKKNDRRERQLPVTSLRR